MSAAAYDWLEDQLEAEPRGVARNPVGEDGADDDELLFPCERSASLSFRRAVVTGDVARARTILAMSGIGALDVPRLMDVMHFIAHQGLVPDLLRAGLREEHVSPALQELWVRATVSANLASDTAALVDAGFAVAPETRQDIRLKAIRSGAWRDVERRV
jgi:hypothetical protein